MAFNSSRVASFSTPSSFRAATILFIKAAKLRISDVNDQPALEITHPYARKQPKALIPMSHVRCDELSRATYFSHHLNTLESILPIPLDEPPLFIIEKIEPSPPILPEGIGLRP